MPVESAKSVEFSRRHFLAGSAALAAAAAVPSRPLQAQAIRPARVAKPALRIAHMTDFHIQPELAAGDGVIAALRHVQTHHKPDFILTGGDHVMDSFDATHDRTKLQWDLWAKVVKAECSLPIHSVIGNHDVFGWNKAKSKTTGNEPEYGKNWVLEIFGRDKPYASFDQGAWHFVLLDSITQVPSGGYIGKLDDEQFAWLESDLASVKPETNVCVVSHIPIFGACSIIPGTEREADGSLRLNGALLHSDMPELTALFRKHPAVKLCLSGHIHMDDRTDFRGVTYYCNGAVSGAWWRADKDHSKPGYATLDLNDDGTFSREYHEYQWAFRQ